MLILISIDFKLSISKKFNNLPVDIRDASVFNFKEQEIRINEPNWIKSSLFLTVQKDNWTGATSVHSPAAII